MKIKTLILLGMGLGVAACASYGLYGLVGNMLLESEIAERFDLANPEQKKKDAQMLLEHKCAACHGADAQVMPLLDTLSGGLQTRDVLGAQRTWLLTSDEKIRRHSVDALKMQHVIEQKSMPPIQYKIVHWGSGLSDFDAKVISSLYPKQSPYAPIKPRAEMSAALKDKVLLGHLLYFDTRLSTTDKVSCASCHDLTKGGTDNLEKSEGVPKDGKPQLGGVNAPTVFNAEKHIAQFWDGRAADLKAQAGGPPLNPVEMGYAVPEDWQLIAAKLTKDPRLVELFTKVYGDATINADRITEAIACFEESLVTPDSAFDKYLQGNKKAMTEQQIRGMELFSQNGCATCHSGMNLGGDSFEYINNRADLRSHLAERAQDGANGLKDFTKNEKDADFFRVPTLRNIALTGPYMHTGKVTELKEAVRLMYETQAGITPSYEMVADVVAFLEAQTGTYKGKALNELKPQDVAPPAPAPTAAPSL